MTRNLETLTVDIRLSPVGQFIRDHVTPFMVYAALLPVDLEALVDALVDRHVQYRINGGRWRRLRPPVD